MTLPVYVPDWQIGDGDIERPYVGMALSHVLLFRTEDKDPDRWRKLDPELSRILGKSHRFVQFGQKVTVTGIAEYLADHAQHALGAFPTAIHCEGFDLYWDAPAVTEGPVTLTGIIDATDYGTAPEGFPEVSGVVDSMELASLHYVNKDGGGIHWEPAPDHQQAFRPISRYPRYVPEPAETGVSPHTQVTGVVLHLDIEAVGTAAEPAEAGAASTAKTPAPPAPAADGSVIRIRIFPDYADTVLWLHGPVDYADATISPGLAADMAGWEASYYESLDGNQAWKSRSRAAQFTATGQELAQRLAVELGEGFEVEFHSYAPGSTRQVFRSDKHSRNTAAADAFRGIVIAEEELQATFKADKADGVGWFAYAPLSGTVFNPSNIPLPELYTDPELE